MGGEEKQRSMPAGVPKHEPRGHSRIALLSRLRLATPLYPSVCATQLPEVRRSQSQSHGENIRRSDRVGVLGCGCNLQERRAGLRVCSDTHSLRTWEASKLAIALC